MVPVEVMQLFNEDGIRFTQHVSVFFLHFTEDSHAQTRPREWVTVNHVVREAEFQTNLTHFVFKQFTQRFNQIHLHVFWQATHIVV